MPNVELEPDIADVVPWSDVLTDYDERHLIVYLRLLDAMAAGASDDDMIRIVLRLDPNNDPARAQSALETHMSRARWMTEHGYRQLLKK